MEEMEDLNEQTNAKQNKLVKYSLAALAILIGIGFVVAIVVVVILHYNAPMTSEGERDAASTTMPSMTTDSNDEPITAMDIYNYFPESNRDGMKIRFFHAANSKEDLALALEGNTTQALEGDVNLKYYGTPSQTDEPVMNSPPELIADVNLYEWLDAVIPSHRVIKLDLKIDEVVPVVFESLRSRKSTLHQPIWINAHILKGPNSDRQTVLDRNEFFKLLNNIFPHVTVSLGWINSVDYDSEEAEYTWEMIDEMLDVAGGVSQRVTILVRAASIKNSWDRFLWLLEEHDRYSLTVYDEVIDLNRPADIVFLRDNAEKSRIFYDLTQSAWEEFQKELDSSSRIKAFYSGGNVLEYFQIPNRKAIEVTWAHRVVGREDLNSTLYDDRILMLETDIQLYGAGTALEDSSLPVMAHDPPALNYELTFEEWMNEVIKSNQAKGIKLDFKSIGALEAALPVLDKLKASLRIPVWINSDVIKGPNSATRPRNATLFFSLIQEKFPHVTISPGWTTTYRPAGNNEGYTQEMVEEMYEACSSMRQAITFPVRASLARRSIPHFQWLLAKSNRYTLTVWHSTSEVVLNSDLLEVYRSFPLSKVYFDIPDEMMKELLEAISKSS